MFGLGLVSRAQRLRDRTSQGLRHLLRPRLIFGGNTENIAVVYSEPHDMVLGDRIMLYSLIRGLKPENYLEIGVRWGGSAWIVATAMQANGFGTAVGLDPIIDDFRPNQSELFSRYQLLKGYSPEDVAKTADLVTGLFDLVFIDAVHTYSAVKTDIAGVLPFIAEGGAILFHDAFHQGINQAIDECLADNPDFRDLGILSRNAVAGLPASYMGLRLIKKGPATDFLAELSTAHGRAELPAPVLDPAVWDYDEYANYIGNPLGRPDIDPPQGN